MIDTTLKNGILFIVSTPIGNLEDISLRALKTLNSVEIIFCEDTRETSKLLNHYKIQGKRLFSFHEHNEDSQANKVLEILQSGINAALVSDAGTPTISDPGYKLVRFLIKQKIKIVSIPGSSAMLTALSSSGIATDKFTFFGFPPQKKGRAEYLNMIAQHPYTSIIYESPHKIVDFIDSLAEIVDNSREICIARELTKRFEEVFTGNIIAAKEFLSNKDRILGEFVVILSGTDLSKEKNKD